MRSSSVRPAAPARLIYAGSSFNRGSVDLENTLATAVGDDDDVVNVKAGGFQVGGGLRLKF